MHESVSAVKLSQVPAPGHPEFIGPLTEAQYREMELSYLPDSIAPHAREIIHDSVKAHINRLAIAQKMDVGMLDNSQLFDLRRRVFATRLRNRRA